MKETSDGVQEAGWKVVISPVSLIVLPHHVHHNCLELSEYVQDLMNIFYILCIIKPSEDETTAWRLILLSHLSCTSSA